MFTRGLFTSETVRVHGFPWFEEEPVRSVDDLVVRCLCEGHNSALSPLDQTAIDVNNVMRRLDELRSIRRGIGGRKWGRAKFVVSGRSFERWALKTIVNLAHARRSEAPGWRPPELLVRGIFGRDHLPDDAGCATVAWREQQIVRVDGFEAVFIRDTAAQTVGGAMLRFRGYNFLFTWDRPHEAILPFPFDGAIASPDTLMRRPRVLQDDVENTAIEFDWSGRTAHAPEVVRLRTRYPSPPR